MTEVQWHGMDSAPTDGTEIEALTTHGGRVAIARAVYWANWPGWRALDGDGNPAEPLDLKCAVWRPVGATEPPAIRVGAFSATEKQAAAERELKMRRRVYPRLVEGGRMTQADADHETALMEDIVADYAALASKERLL